MRLKVSSAKRRPFCLGLNELIVLFFLFCDHPTIVYVMTGVWDETLRSLISEWWQYGVVVCNYYPLTWQIKVGATDASRILVFHNVLWRCDDGAFIFYKLHRYPLKYTNPLVRFHDDLLISLYCLSLKSCAVNSFRMQVFRWESRGLIHIQYFSKPGDAFMSAFRLVLSHLACSCMVLPHLCIW